MKRDKIIISDCGAVAVPNNVRMTISEIANMFGIYYQTAKRHIRSIEKSGVANGDCSMICVVEGKKVVPEYYGLEMIIAVSFRIHSAKADIFRSWVLKKVVKRDIITTLVLPLQNTLLN